MTVKTWNQGIRGWTDTRGPQKCGVTGCGHVGKDVSLVTFGTIQGLMCAAHWAECTPDRLRTSTPRLLI